MITKDKIFSITRKRIAFFLTCALMFIITEIGRNIYRPYIYSNDIFDFYIADTIGNLTGTITVIFSNLTFTNPTHKMGWIVLGGTTLGLIVYEFAQYFSPRSVLDWRDIVATLIGGLISLGIYELLTSLFKEKSFSNPKAG